MVASGGVDAGVLNLHSQDQVGVLCQMTEPVRDEYPRGTT